MKNVSGLSLLWAQPSMKIPTISQVANTMVSRSSRRLARGRPATGDGSIGRFVTEVMS